MSPQTPGPMIRKTTRPRTPANQNGEINLLREFVCLDLVRCSPQCQSRQLLFGRLGYVDSDVMVHGKSELETDNSGSLQQ